MGVLRGVGLRVQYGRFRHGSSSYQFWNFFIAREGEQRNSFISLFLCSSTVVPTFTSIGRAQV